MRSETVDAPEAQRVLVIDDSPEDREFYARLLARHPEEEYLLSEADSGESGLVRCRKDRPMCVLLDFRLPDVDGLEFLEELQKDQGDNSPPVIMLTGEGSEEIAVKALKAGAQDYLVKSKITTELLGLAIARAIQNVAVGRKLRELEVLKADFLATASHELRTPLTIIREFVSLVLDRVVGSINDEQEECLDAALRNCDRLGNLIDDILDLQRIETGKNKLERRELSLPILLKNCVRDFSPTCERKAQRLQLEVDEALPSILGDRDKITQVLVNLIGNAQKFTPEGERITVRAFLDDPDATSVTVEVEDSGIGISEADQELVFDKFAQVGRQDGPGSKGTGLGLAIARSIIDFHDGDMRLRSTPGEGSTFSFTVPIYSDTGEMAALVVDALRAARAAGKSLDVILVTTEPDPTDPQESHFTVAKIEEGIRSMLRRKDDRTLVLQNKQMVMVVAEVEEKGSLSLAHRIEYALLREFPAARERLRLSHGNLREDDSVDEWLRALVERCEPLGAAPFRKKVLIIDDNEAILDLLSDVFEQSRLPLQVTCTSNGYDGCARFSELAPELVLLDLSMPGLNGEQVLERLRKDPNWSATKVMIITGTGASPSQLKKLGADVCLTKPLDLAELVETTGALLGEEPSLSRERLSWTNPTAEVRNV